MEECSKYVNVLLLYLSFEYEKIIAERLFNVSSLQIFNCDPWMPNHEETPVRTLQNVQVAFVEMLEILTIPLPNASDNSEMSSVI